MQSNGKKIIQNVLLVFVLGVAAIRLFYRLGAGTLQNTDEAWYAVNTCEMFKNGDLLVPTIAHKIDIRSKPPLGLWCIMLGYKIFGIDLTGLRMYSAVSGFMIIVLICIYLYKKHDIRYSIVAAAVFPTIWQAFELHGFRAGDMDALFCLLYVIAIFALKEVAEGNPRMLILYTAVVGLGFLTKSLHVIIFVLVGFFYLPVIFRKIRVKELLISLFAGALPTVLWIIARYQIDGWDFVRFVTIGEAGEKTEHKFTIEYIRSLGREKIIWLLGAVLLLRVVIYFCANAGDSSFNKLGKDLLEYLKKRYLSIISFAIPVALYTYAGMYMSWYIYPCFMTVVWMIACNVCEIADRFDKKILQNLLIYSVSMICLLYSLIHISQYSGLGEGGNPNDQFRHALYEFTDINGDEYKGYKAYAAYDRGRVNGDRGHWELEYLFYGEAIADFECLDGGVEGFLNDEDSLIVLDSSLWDEYADVLTGYVFLEQNDFFVLSHDRYY